ATISAAPDPELLGPLVVPEAWRREAESALAALGADDARPLLVLHPGAGGRWKRWPAGEMAAAVAQALDGTDAQALAHPGPPGPWFAKGRPTPTRRRGPPGSCPASPSGWSRPRCLCSPRSSPPRRPTPGPTRG